MRTFIKTSLLIFLMLSAHSALAADPTTSCPTGFICCPDLSNAMSIDPATWQLTGQPLKNNTFSMAWWSSINTAKTKGYITCYYNLQAPAPFTLESIYPVQTPKDEQPNWKKDDVAGRMTCHSENVFDCPVVEDIF